MKKIFWAAVLGAICSSAAFLVSNVGLLQNWEMKTYDLRMTLAEGRRPKPQNVAMFYVDEDSLRHMESLGVNWPWPRELYASALDFCRRGGARAVVFDLFFSEESVYGVADDEAFAAGIAAGPPAYFVLFLTKNDMPDDPRIEKILAKARIPFEGNLPAWIIAENGLASLPIGPVVETAAGFGNAQVAPDTDGVYRRIPLAEKLRQQVVPSLALKVAADVSETGKILWPQKTQFLLIDDDTKNGTFPVRPEPVEGRTVRASTGSARAGSSFSPPEINSNDKIPLDDSGRMLINYYGGIGAFPSFPLAKVLVADAAIAGGQKPDVDPSVVKDKIVIIGLAAPGLYDTKSTPFSRVYPGAEIHATAIENILTRDFITQVRMGGSASVTLAAGILAALGLAWISSSWGIAGWILIFTSSLVGGGFLLFTRGISVPLVPPFCAVSLSSFVMVMKNYLTEGRKKREIRRAFGQYLSPHVVAKIAKDPDSLILGGTERCVTLFFSDIADFTTISEQTKPAELVGKLNEYFSATTRVIQNRGGTLDKYIGDAIMAFWGAPLATGDHAAQAILAAIEIQKTLAANSPFTTRIGIHTGPAIIGNIGSDIRFNYTAIGDTVNLASRLEGLNKKFGTFIIASEPTIIAARDSVEARRIGRVRVKGRDKPVSIYEPLGEKGDFGKLGADVCKEFMRALELYEASKFAEAMLSFKKISNDPVSERYLASCEKYQREAPADFDGVTTFTTK